MDGMCSHLLDSDTYRWSVIRAYYSRYGHARASIEGYEQFLGELVPCIIQENSTIDVASITRRVDHCIEFNGVTIFPPRYVRAHYVLVKMP